MYLFDYSKHPPHPTKEEIQPQMVLCGQKDVGFAIDWNDNKDGMLLSGSNLGDCCIWDIRKTPSQQSPGNLFSWYLMSFTNYQISSRIIKQDSIIAIRSIHINFIFYISFGRWELISNYLTKFRSKVIITGIYINKYNFL